MTLALSAAALVVAGLTSCGDQSATRAALPEVPPPPVGFAPVEFSVAAPMVAPTSGGGWDQPRRACAPAEIRAQASTRSTPGGVLGVLHLEGATIGHEHGVEVRCALPVTHGPSGLIGVRGRHLPVRRSAGDTVDPPVALGARFSSGEGSWGFAWMGSYCGPRAYAIEIPLDDADRRWLRVPLNGPQPVCAPDLDRSVLVDGVAGAPGEAVQPPRPEFSRLRLTGSIDPGTTTTMLAPLHLTLTATGQSPVTLDPCPHYQGMLWGQAASGGFGNGVADGQLPCMTHVVVIKPGAPLHWTIHNLSVEQSPDIHPKPGSTVSITIGIAGVEQITLRTIAH